VEAVATEGCGVTRLWDRLVGRGTAQRYAPVTGDEWTYLMSSYGQPNAEKIQPTFVQYATQGYAGNSVVFAVIGQRITLFSEATFKYRSLSDKHLFGDESLKKLETPWPNGTTADLLARMEQDVSLAGNAYIRDAGSQLERLRPDWVTIVSEVSHDALGRQVREVRGYLFEPVGDPERTTEFYLVDEVAHWAPIPDPLANFRGMSWLTPVIREIDADVAMLQHQQAFYNNAASPNMVIKYQGKLVEEQINRIRNAIAARHAGPRNAGGTMVLDQGADLTIVGDRMQGSAFSDLRAAGESRIASAGQVPPLLAGLREGMQASAPGEYPQAMRKFADGLIRSNWRGVCGALSAIVDVPAGAQLWVDTSDITALQPGESDAAGVMQQQAGTANTLIIAGFTPPSVLKAITANDLTLLEHSGMTSVQLYKPGENNSTATPDNPPPATDAQPTGGKPAADNPTDAPPADKAPPKEPAKPAGRHRRHRGFDIHEPRDSDGQWSKVGATVKHLLSDQELLDTYGPDYSDHEFGDGGHVRTFENGDLAVTFDNEGRHEVWADMSSDDARQLSDDVVWAARADPNGPDYRDTPASSNGLVDWVEGEDDGPLVGFYPTGDVRVGWPNGDGTYDEFDASRDEAFDFSNALDDAARDAEQLS